MRPLHGVALFLLTAILAPLVVEEIKAWCPQIAYRLLRRAASKLPEPERSRLYEEWAAEIREIPGPLSKVFFSASLTYGARQIRNDLTSCCQIDRFLRLRQNLRARSISVSRALVGKRGNYVIAISSTLTTACGFEILLLRRSFPTNLGFVSSALLGVPVTVALFAVGLAGICQFSLLLWMRKLSTTPNQGVN
jgi:hypothetical protein